MSTREGKEILLVYKGARDSWMVVGWWLNIPLCMLVGSLMEGGGGGREDKERLPHILIFIAVEGSSVTKWALLVTTDVLI